MPAKRRLTDKYLKSLKPKSKAYEVGDDVIKGLAIRVWSTGGMTWSLRYYPKGREKRISLGDYSVLGLGEARDEALDIKKKMRRGKDPRRSELKISLSEAVERWSADQKARDRKSWPEIVRILKLHILPELGDVALADINRADVRRLLERLRDDKGLSAQVNRLQWALSGVLSWGVDAGEIETHPMTRMRPLVQEQPRDVVLSIDQLAAIWRAADEVPSLAAPAVKLLLLTAARREEVGQLRWTELDLDRGFWHLPSERHKGKRGLSSPLARATVEILKAIPRGVNGDYVFSSNGGARPFNGWTRLALNLRERAALNVTWQIHDLRRGVATALGDHVHASEELVGQVLGHSKRSRIGVTATYDRAERSDTRKRLLENWANLLIHTAEGTVEGNVVPMRLQ